MNVLIIGGVAAGTKTAAKLKRMAPDARVTLLAKDKDISYAGCGLPYYVGGAIPTRDQLIVNTPAAYAALTGVEVRTGMEAIHLDAAGHTVTVRDLATGAESQVGYDACMIATGASPAVPPLPGVGSKGVFCLRTPDDAEGIRRYVEEKPVRRAVVVGGGFIGLEIAENLVEKQVSVTVAEMAGQIMPNVLDPEMAGFAKKQLQEAGLRVLTGVKVEEILTADGAATGVRTAAGTLPADLVVLSVGCGPTPPGWPTPAWRCSRAPSWWTTGCAPACPTCTPPATASWSKTASPASASGRPWALPPTMKAEPWAGCWRARPAGIPACWAPAWSSCRAG